MSEHNGRTARIKITLTGSEKRYVGGLYTNSDPDILAPCRKLCLFVPVERGIDSLKLDHLIPELDEDGERIEYHGRESRVGEKLRQKLRSYIESNGLDDIDFIDDNKIRPYLTQ